MPVPGSFTDLSETPSANSPAGSEAVGPQMNDYIQAAYAFIKMIYDGQQNPTAAVPFNNQKISGLANGTANTDAATIGQLNTTLGAPSGTRAVFQQAAAPTGWTVDANANLKDCAMRFNNVGFGSNAGTTTWSGWNFGGSFNTNGTALSTAQLPAHSHADAGHNHFVNDPGHGHGVSDPGHGHTASGGNFVVIGGGGGNGLAGGGQAFAFPGATNNAGTGIGINGSGTGIFLSAASANIQNTGSGATHLHTLVTPQVRFADCIVGIKS